MELSGLIAGFFTGVVLGTVVIWLIQRREQQRLTGLWQESREQAIRYEQQALAADQQATRWKAEIESARQTILDLTAAAGSLRAEKEALLAEKANWQSQVQGMQQQLQEQFELISHRVLQRTSQAFSETSQERMSAVLTPLKEKIEQFEKKVSDNSVQSESSIRVLQQQIKDLGELNKKISTDAENLTLALKGDKKMQGNWGEFQLETLLEKAGLEKGIHFQTQVSAVNEDGNRQQPDVVILLPDNKHLIIDSKVSLVAYTNWFQAETDADRERFLRDHLAAIRSHIRLLSDKKYDQLDGLNTPDYVMMFIPVEPAFSLAVQSDQGLYLQALEKNIVLVTTSTLLATLRTVASIWKQENQRRNVQEIADEAGKLYDKFHGFMEDFTQIGDRLGSTKKSFDLAMNKLSEGSGNILGRFEKMKKLGARASKQLDRTLLDAAKDVPGETS